MRTLIPLRQNNHIARIRHLTFYIVICLFFHFSNYIAGYEPEQKEIYNQNKAL